MKVSNFISDSHPKLEQDWVEDRFSGAALIARRNEIIFAEAYGMADRERGIANTLWTRFRIGSMNKMFTAVAILQLAEAGKLQLTDSLAKYFSPRTSCACFALFLDHKVGGCRTTSVAPIFLHDYDHLCFTTHGAVQSESAARSGVEEPTISKRI
jgi:hypothetical protein